MGNKYGFKLYLDKDAEPDEGIAEPVCCDRVMVRWDYTDGLRKGYWQCSVCGRKVNV